MSDETSIVYEGGDGSSMEEAVMVKPQFQNISDKDWTCNYDT